MVSCNAYNPSLSSLRDGVCIVILTCHLNLCHHLYCSYTLLSVSYRHQNFTYIVINSVEEITHSFSHFISYYRLELHIKCKLRIDVQQHVQSTYQRNSVRFTTSIALMGISRHVGPISR